MLMVAPSSFMIDPFKTFTVAFHSRSVVIASSFATSSSIASMLAIAFASCIIAASVVVEMVVMEFVVQKVGPILELKAFLLLLVAVPQLVAMELESLLSSQLFYLL
jgi:hypothetical protein